MLKKYILLLFLIPFSAFAIPDKTLIEVEYHPGEILFIHNNTNVKCSQIKQGQVVLGCARIQREARMKMRCANRYIKLDIYGINPEIEIHSDLHKGTCEYQEVLDHEMTHMDLHADALEAIVQTGMNDIVNAFNANFQGGRGCRAAIDAAEKEFHIFAQNYVEEDRHLNQMFDRNDVDSVVQNCKTPPKIEIIYQPPEIKYTSADWIECRHRKTLCLDDNGNVSCDRLNTLSCTEMPMKYSFNMKPYLAQVRFKIDVPEIETKISSRFSPGSCEYETLKEHELSLVDDVENIFDTFSDQAEKEARKAYNHALEKEYTAEDLVKDVKFIFEKQAKEMNEKIAKKAISFKPMTEKQLEEKCKK